MPWDAASPPISSPRAVGPRRRLRPFDALLLASLLLPGLLFAVIAVRDRHQTLGAARRELLVRLDTLHGHAEKVFQFQALAIGAADELLRGLTEAAILTDQAAHHAHLAALRQHAGAEIGLVVFGADGRPLAEAEQPAPRRAFDVSDRAYFAAHRDDPATGPRIATPLRSRADGWPFFFVTRRRSTPEGGFAGILAAGIRQQSLIDYWDQAAPEPASVVTLFLRDGTVLARRPGIDPDLRPRLAPDSAIMRAVAEAREHEVVVGVSPLDGVERLIAYRGIGRFPEVAIAHGVALDAALAPWRRRVLVYGGFALAAAGALFGLALLARRRADALHALNAALEDRVAAGTAESRASEARVRLLAAEVDHRAKNLLAVVQATLRLTPKHDAAAYARAVEGRIAALARAQTLLSAEHWRGADLRALLQAELAPFLPAAGGAGPRVELGGPAVTVPAHAVQPLAMAAHELATNAVKHGALSVPGGHVAVSWRVLPGGAVSLRWAEAGGPKLAVAPARRGFGSRVLDQVVRGQLGGRLEMPGSRPAWPARSR
jgi:two-component sensor histidine kinase